MRSCRGAEPDFVGRGLSELDFLWALGFGASVRLEGPRIPVLKAAATTHTLAVGEAVC